MTPIGYLRKLEALMVLMRDHRGQLCDLQMSAEGQALEAKLNAAADAIDQAWDELVDDDRLMVFNIAQHFHDLVRLKKPKSTPERAADAVEPKPLIQLLH